MDSVTFVLSVVFEPVGLAVVFGTVDVILISSG